MVAEFSVHAPKTGNDGPDNWNGGPVDTLEQMVGVLEPLFPFPAISSRRERATVDRTSDR